MYLRPSFRSALYEKIGYEPYEKQWQTHTAGARFTSLRGAARSGKSLWAARHAQPFTFYPSKIWIVGPTYEIASKEYLYLLDGLAKIDPTLARNFKQSYHGGPGGVLPSGCEIRCKSADNPDSLLGDEVDCLVLCEAPRIKESVWERFLRARIGPRLGHVIAGFTPQGYDWTHRVFELPAGDGNADYFHQHVTIYDNPYYDHAEAERARSDLSDAAWREQFLGERVHFTGLVYPEFGEENICDLRFEDGLETIVGVDFGYNTAAVGWYQVARKEGREELRLVTEWVQHQVSTEAIANYIAGHPQFPRLVVIYCDPAGGAHAPQTGMADVDLLRSRLQRRVDFPRRPEDRSIRTGIDRLRGLICAADGTRRYFVNRTCHHTIDDYRHYRYPESSTKPDEPIKDGIHDHTMDRDRYVAVCRFPIISGAVRSERHDPLEV